MTTIVVPIYKLVYGHYFLSSSICSQNERLFYIKFGYYVAVDLCCQQIPQSYMYLYNFTRASRGYLIRSTNEPGNTK